MYRRNNGGFFKELGHGLYSASSDKTENVKITDDQVGLNGDALSSAKHKPIIHICLKCVYIPVVTIVIQ